MEYESPTGIIKRVGGFLSVPLPLDNVPLINHLTALEACRYELADKSTEWHRKVAEYRNRMLHPKDKEFTELDRTTMLDAHVAVVRQDYEFLCKLEDLVKERIQLGKTLLTLNQNTI
jgi:hypothetical protein